MSWENSHTTPDESSATARSIGQLTLLALYFALVLAVVVTFGGAVSNEAFVVDDPDYVFAEPHVLGGFTADNVAWALRGPHGGNWHPLTSCSHMLDVTWFGVDPAGHHAVNVALHALAAVLVGVGLSRLTRAPWASFAVASLFALHPLRVESVAWIAERKDVLSGVCFGLALIAYARYVERPSALRMAACVVVFALGLASKPMLVTLPCVFLLLDAWPLGRAGTPSRWRPKLREKSLLFALSAASCVVTFVVQRQAGAFSAGAGIPLLERFANAPVAVMTYLRQTVWPIDLAPYYPFQLTKGVWIPIVCTALLCLLSIAAWRQRHERRYVAVGWFLFLGMLVPVIGIVQVGGQAHADRYTYLPSIGVFVIVAFAARELAARRPSLQNPIVLAFVFACIASVALSRAQVLRWKDSRTLALHMLAATGDDNAFAHQILAKAVIDVDPAMARTHLERALAIVPNLRGAHGSLGILLARERRYAEAAAEFRAEIAVEERPFAYKNLGFALAYAGRGAEALRAFEDSLRLDDTDLDLLLEVAWSRAASADASVRDAAKALRFAARAREIAGADDPRVGSTLAAAHAEEGDFATALSLAQGALSRAQTGLAERVRLQIEAYSHRQPFRP